MPDLFFYTDADPIFTNKNLKSNNLKFWKEWDQEKVEVQNQSIGPRNAFEEQIEWTKKGKMWPYPIDNEYMFGLEHKVNNLNEIKHSLKSTERSVNFLLEKYIFFLKNIFKNSFSFLGKIPRTCLRYNLI